MCAFHTLLPSGLIINGYMSNKLVFIIMVPERKYCIKRDLFRWLNESRNYDMYKREIDNQAVVKNSSQYLKLIAIRFLTTQDTFFCLFLVSLYCGSALVVRRNTLTQCNVGLYCLDISNIDSVSAKVSPLYLKQNKISSEGMIVWWMLRKLAGESKRHGRLRN